MNSTEAQEPSEEELDLLQHGHEAAGTGLSEDAADTIAFTTEGKDLLADADLRGIMAQFNPAASKDILAIEKGVENFFLFHQAPHALARPQQMEHLGPRELQVLEERDTFVRFAFIACAEESGQLFTQEVLIRPSSLKADQVAKVKNACVRASATSIAQYIDLRDRQLQQMERSDELGKWVSARFMQSGGDGETIRATSQKDVHQLMLSLHNLSFEAFLENEIKAPEELIIPVMALLKRPADFILSELQIGPTIPDAARAVLETRARLPLLIALSADFHLIQPPAGHLIEMEDGQVKEHRSELEWIYVLHVQMARRILFILLPEEETGWIQTRGTAQDKRYLEELRKHPSFTAGESWQGGVEFLTCYEALLKIVRQTRAIRREYLIELVTEDTVKKLNMQFEPVLFSPESFEIPDPNIESYIKREELYEHVIERMKKMSDVFSYEERRQGGGPRGTYFLYLYNMPRAFIDNKNRRHFLHMVCRNNGMEKGIYDMLIEVNSTTPREIEDEQIALSRAIRDWEAEIEKERLRKERARLGIWGRFVLFLKSLFGMDASPRRRSEDHPDEEESAPRKRRNGKPRKTGVLVGPREREVTIPAKVQKAIDYVDRNFKGIIWIDEVLLTLGTVKYTADQIGDYLYYDKQNRYIEVKPLINIRRVFLRRENEGDPRWVQATIDYLENVAQPREEHSELLRHLRAIDY